MKKIRMLLIAGLIFGLAVGCDNWKESAPVAAVAPTAQVVAVARTAPVADECQKETMKVGTLLVDKAEVKEAKIDKARINKAEIKVAKINKAEIELAEIELARIKKAEIELAEIELAKIKKAEIEAEGKKHLEPMITFALKCNSGVCWPKNPKGDYFPLGKFGNIPLVGNKNNPYFKEENSISAKRELHGVWGKKMVARNLTVPLETLLAVPGLSQEISQHFEKMGSQWPIDPSDKDGKVCDEKTWIINTKAGTWTIRK